MLHSFPWQSKLVSEWNVGHFMKLPELLSWSTLDLLRTVEYSSKKLAVQSKTIWKWLCVFYVNWMQMWKVTNWNNLSVALHSTALHFTMRIRKILEWKKKESHTFPNLDTECYFSCIFNHALNHMQLPYSIGDGNRVVFFFLLHIFLFLFTSHLFFCCFDKFDYASMCMRYPRQQHTKGNWIFEAIQILLILYDFLPANGKANIGLKIKLYTFIHDVYVK